MRNLTNLKTWWVTLILMLAMFPAMVLADVFYVDEDATGANNGTSWDDAFNYLQDGLSEAGYGEQIFVAEGTYRPDETTTNPDGSGDWEATFQLKNDVALYGGFPSGGGTWAQRDPNRYMTILSGDLNDNDIEVEAPQDLWLEPSRSDNSLHIVTGNGTNATAVLDGFILTRGQATRSSSTRAYSSGGGMYNDTGNPTVTNCTFIGNCATNDGIGGGGGMYNYYSNPTVTNCRFIDNVASNYGGGGGGGMYNRYSDPTVVNCTFTGNSAAAHCGGAIWNIWSNPTLIDCTFTENFASFRGGAIQNGYGSFSPTLIGCTFVANHSGDDGGGMYNFSSSPTLANCTFSGNTASNDGGGIANCYGNSPTVTNCTFIGNSAGLDGGGMYNQNSSSNPTVTNCILWGNAASRGNEIYNNSSYPVISYCDIAGSGGSDSWDTDFGSDGGGNIDVDPLFIDPNGPDGVLGTEDDNLRLLTGSPCIDTGDNSVVEPNSTDLDGNPRIINGIVDMGAYEWIVPTMIEVAMKFTPQALNPTSGGKWVKAHLVLPEGFVVDDVDADTPAQIEQLGIESEYMNVFINDEGLVKIEAAFSRGDFCGGVDFGPAEVTVAGRLTSGQYFYGSDTIRIITNKLGYVGALASYWLGADCSPSDWCAGLDVDQDSVVDWLDFAMSDGCCIEVIEE